MEKKKMSMGKRIAICIFVPIVTFVIVLAVLLAVRGGGQTDPQSQNAIAGVAVESQEPAYFYEDDFVAGSFVEVFEESSVSGTGYIKVSFTNKADQEITVYPVNSSVNDTMVQYLSGTPAKMQAGKSIKQVWFFSYENAGISELEDIEKLEFSLLIVDENTKTLAETPIVSVKVSDLP